MKSATGRLSNDSMPIRAKGANLSDSKFPNASVYFNRPNAPIKLWPLIQAIKSANRRVYLASAWFSSVEIGKAIISSSALSKIILVGSGTLDDKTNSSVLTDLINVGIEVYLSHNSNYKYQPMMHHKFIVIDDAVWTGSCNFTYSSKRNFETLLHFDESPELAQRFCLEFFSILGSSHDIITLEK